MQTIQLYTLVRDKAPNIFPQFRARKLLKLRNSVSELTSKQSLTKDQSQIDQLQRLIDPIQQEIRDLEALAPLQEVQGVAS